jgi:hypothetical protein
VNIPYGETRGSQTGCWSGPYMNPRAPSVVRRSEVTGSGISICNRPNPSDKSPFDSYSRVKLRKSLRLAFRAQQSDVCVCLEGRQTVDGASVIKRRAGETRRGNRKA